MPKKRKKKKYKKKSKKTINKKKQNKDKEKSAKNDTITFCEFLPEKTYAELEQEYKNLLKKYKRRFFKLQGEKANEIKAALSKQSKITTDNLLDCYRDTIRYNILIHKFIVAWFYANYLIGNNFVAVDEKTIKLKNLVDFVNTYLIANSKIDLTEKCITHLRVCYEVMNYGLEIKNAIEFKETLKKDFIKLYETAMLLLQNIKDKKEQRKYIDYHLNVLIPEIEKHPDLSFFKKVYNTSRRKLQRIIDGENENHQGVPTKPESDNTSESDSKSSEASETSSTTDSCGSDELKETTDNVESDLSPEEKLYNQAEYTFFKLYQKKNKTLADYQQMAEQKSKMAKALKKQGLFAQATTHREYGENLLRQIGPTV